jgi:molybdenum cofactor biosynthesis protein B
MPIKEDLPFHPVRIAVLTVSDSRDLTTDKSGDTLVARIEGAGHIVADRAIVRDDVALITGKLSGWIDDPQVDCVITTGGTGVTGRDVTPEALAAVWDKEIPGFGELFRWLSYAKIGTRRSSRAPPPASPAAPISSRCPARPARSGTAGTTSSSTSSTAASCPATSSS